MEQTEPALEQTESISEVTKSEPEVEQIQTDLEIKLEDKEPLPVQGVIEETKYETEEKTLEASQDDVAILQPVASQPEAMDETSLSENIATEAEHPEKELEVSEIINLLIFSNMIYYS